MKGDTLTGTLTRASGENVGKYMIARGTLSASPNYALAFVGDSLAILPKSVQVTVRAASKALGTADPALSYDVVGLLSGDTLSGTLTRAPGDTVGSYAILLGSLGNSDYAVDYRGADLTILPAGPMAQSAVLHYTQSSGSDTLYVTFSETVHLKDDGTVRLEVRDSTGHLDTVTASFAASQDGTMWAIAIDSGRVRRGETVRLISDASSLVDSLGRAAVAGSPWISVSSISRNMIVSSEPVLLTIEEAWQPTGTPFQILYPGSQERQETWVDGNGAEVATDQLVGLRLTLRYDTSRGDRSLTAYIYDRMGTAVQCLASPSVFALFKKTGTSPGGQATLWLAWNGVARNGVHAVTGVYPLRVVLIPLGGNQNQPAENYVKNIGLNLDKYDSIIFH